MCKGGISGPAGVSSCTINIMCFHLAKLAMLLLCLLFTRFEAGALGQLPRAVNVTNLHLEILPESSSSTSSSVTPLSPSAAAAGLGKSPSELARLQVGGSDGQGGIGRGAGCWAVVCRMRTHAEGGRGDSEAKLKFS